MARFNLVKRNNPQKAELIKDGMVRSRSVRKAVLADDISDLSKVEENFNERDDRIKAGEMKPRG